MAFWRLDAQEIIEKRLQLSFSYWEDMSGYPFLRPRVYKNEDGSYNDHNLPPTYDDAMRLYHSLVNIIDAHPNLSSSMYDYEGNKLGETIPQWHDRLRSAARNAIRKNPETRGLIEDLLREMQVVSNYPDGTLGPHWKAFIENE
jgi:hypothetical protein